MFHARNARSGPLRTQKKDETSLSVDENQSTSRQGAEMLPRASFRIMVCETDMKLPAWLFVSFLRLRMTHTENGQARLLQLYKYCLDRPLLSFFIPLSHPSTTSGLNP